MVTLKVKCRIHVGPLQNGCTVIDVKSFDLILYELIFKAFGFQGQLGILTSKIKSRRGLLTMLTSTTQLDHRSQDSHTLLYFL